jgi:hypothetical protein
MSRCIQVCKECSSLTRYLHTLQHSSVSQNNISRQNWQVQLLNVFDVFLSARVCKIKHLPLQIINASLAIIKNCNRTKLNGRTLVFVKLSRIVALTLQFQWQFSTWNCVHPGTLRAQCSDWEYRFVQGISCFIKGWNRQSEIFCIFLWFLNRWYTNVPQIRAKPLHFGPF